MDEKPTLRDQFALAALPAFLQSPGTQKLFEEAAKKHGTSVHYQVAKLSYLMADSMVEARGDD
jgi:hypothetical protein